MTFDQLQRYHLAADLIEEVRRGERFSILDAGSREGYLNNFLPRDDITGLDRSYFPGNDFVVGDAARLPFREKSFDIVVALDLLEHIPPQNRLAFFRETNRISREYIIIGAPFQGGEIEAAEKLINDFSTKLSGEKNFFLEEHEAGSLPDMETILSHYRKLGYRAAVIPNGYLPRWTLMMALNTYLENLPSAADIIFKSNRFYHNRFYLDDNRLPAYRRVILFGKAERLNTDEIRKKLIFLPEDGSAEDSSQSFQAIGEISGIIDNDKDCLIKDLTDDIDSLKDALDRLERRRSTEINSLREIIERKSGQLAEIQTSWAYQFLRKCARFFNKSHP